jgi:Cyclin, N-terminal domain
MEVKARGSDPIQQESHCSCGSQQNEDDTNDYDILNQTNEDCHFPKRTPLSPVSTLSGKASSSSIPTSTTVTVLSTSYDQQLELLLQLESLQHYDYQEWYWIPSPASSKTNSSETSAANTTFSDPKAAASTDSSSSNTPIVDLECRTTMIRWYYQFVRHVKLNPITCEYAIWYMDRYMYQHYSKQRSSMQKGQHYSDRLYYQLVCLTCVYMAVKIQESSVGIDLQLISSISRGVHTAQDIIEMESTILHTLQWYMHPPVLSNFVDLYYLTYVQSDENSDDSDNKSISGPDPTSVEPPELLSKILHEKIEETMCSLSTLTSRPTSQIAHEHVQEYILLKGNKRNSCTCTRRNKECDICKTPISKTLATNDSVDEGHDFDHTAVPVEIEDNDQLQYQSTNELHQEKEWKRTESPCTTMITNVCSMR